MIPDILTRKTHDRCQKLNLGSITKTFSTSASLPCKSLNHKKTISVKSTVPLLSEMKDKLSSSNIHIICLFLYLNICLLCQKPQVSDRYPRDATQVPNSQHQKNTFLVHVCYSVGHREKTMYLTAVTDTFITCLRLKLGVSKHSRNDIDNSLLLYGNPQ